MSKDIHDTVENPIPVSQEELDNIAYTVATSLIEQMAIEGRIEDMSQEFVDQVLKDVCFVMDLYTKLMNEVMERVYNETMSRRENFENFKKEKNLIIP
jgi:archaellum component FlaC